MESEVAFLVECFPFVEIEILKFLIQENPLEICFKILLNEQEEIQEPLLIIKKRTKKDLIYKLETEQHLNSLKILFKTVHENAIENVYTDCDGDYEQTARTLSEHLTTNSTDVSIRDRNAINELRMIFPPHVVTERDLLSTFYDTGFDLEISIDTLLQTQTPGTGGRVWKDFNVPKAFANPSEALIDFKITKPQPDTPHTPKPHTITESPTDLRTKATHLTQERSQLYDQARAYFKQGSLTGRSAASFYAEKARDLTQKINLLHELASRAQIQSNSINGSCLDLHGLTVNEAIRYLKDWSKGKTNKDGWLKIITGAGNNSENGKARLFPAVSGYMRKIGWKIDEESSGLGWIVVKLCK